MSDTQLGLMPWASLIPWNRQRPKALVIACSDGRLQENVDEFLEASLGITHYDRLYTPGGPGAFVGLEEMSRAYQLRKECRALVTLHGIEDIVFLFHGPSADGPEEACCGDYKRKMQGHSADEIRARQNQDAEEIIQKGLGEGVNVRMRIYRCEVGPNDSINFVPLASSM